MGPAPNTPMGWVLKDVSFKLKPAFISNNGKRFKAWHLLGDKDADSWHFGRLTGAWADAWAGNTL